MNTRSFRLIRIVLPSLFLAVSVPLMAQQSSPPGAARSGLTAKQADAYAQKLDAAEAQKLRQQCGGLLKPLRTAVGPGKPIADGIDRDEKAFSLRLAKYSDEDLLEAEFQAMDCVTDLPDRRSRKDALDVYNMAVAEWESRVLKDKDEECSKVAEFAAASYREQVKREHDDFLEAAKFAAALWKENQQYKEQESKLLVAIREDRENSEAMYQWAEKAINLAGQALNGSPGLSLPVFVSTPTPQVIRMETPSVPRALHCMANTTGAPLLPQGTSTTWVNCW